MRQASPRFTAVVTFPNLGERDVPLRQPLHQEVALAIQAEIERGGLRAGALLPSERHMCEQFGVSRVTLRRALTALADRGVLSPSHGRGWFVADTTIGELPNMLQSLTELAEARGLRSSSRVSLRHVRAADVDEAEQLAIGPGAALFEMRRLRLLDDVPVALDHVRIPLEVCPQLPEVDFGASSLYRTLESHGVLPTRCDFAVQASAADAAQADELIVSEGTALLLATGTTYNEHNHPIELSRVHFVGERYRFRASLYRNPQP